jgi:hypothetical protein
MGKEFHYPVKYRLRLVVGCYEPEGQMVTGHTLEVDAVAATPGYFPVSPEVRSGLVEAALAVLLCERVGLPPSGVADGGVKETDEGKGT